MLFIVAFCEGLCHFCALWRVEACSSFLCASCSRLCVAMVLCLIIACAVFDGI